MMGAIVLLHRWLGIACCLLFAMWFATGIVMHFVPFPALTEAERFAGLAPVDLGAVRMTAGAAVQASGVADATRVRLLQRPDGPVFVVEGPSRLDAVRAAHGGPAAVAASQQALAIARDHAERRGLPAVRAEVVALADHDQWSVPNGFDRHRPLFRIALGDAAGTEIYVSSVTGDVVLDTTRRERGWTYVGSVSHWIYPTVLRSHWAVWDRVVWWVSLLALTVAMLGAVLGVARIRRRGNRAVSPYRGWHALHHLLGLAATSFVLSWSFSGWLSMDHGRLFSRGEPTPAQAAVLNAAPDWTSAPDVAGEQPRLPLAREIEWFAFDGAVYRRDRVTLTNQVLIGAVGPPRDQRGGALDLPELQGLARRLDPDCDAPARLAGDDDYPIRASVPETPVYRIRCGRIWFDISAADGRLLQWLDPSRRAYRWLYQALHTLDFPALAARPFLREVVIVGLCGLGLAFSVTGIVIGWRRLRLAGTGP